MTSQICKPTTLTHITLEWKLIGQSACFPQIKRPLRLNYTLLALLGFGHFAWFKSGKMLKCHWSFLWMAFGPVGSFRVNGGGHKKMTSWPLQSSLSKSFFFCFRRKYDFTILFNKNDQNGSSKKLQLWLKMWNIPRFWVWSSAVCCDRADDVIFPSRCRHVMRRWAGHGDSVLSDLCTMFIDHPINSSCFLTNLPAPLDCLHV